MKKLLVQEAQVVQMMVLLFDHKLSIFTLLMNLIKQMMIYKRSDKLRKKRK